MQIPFARAARMSGGCLAVVAATAPAALSQVTFSIDNHGPLIGAPDGFWGFRITRWHLRGVDFHPGRGGARVHCNTLRRRDSRPRLAVSALELSERLGQAAMLKPPPTSV